MKNRINTLFMRFIKRLGCLCMMNQELLKAVLGTYSRLIEDIASLKKLIMKKERSIIGTDNKGEWEVTRQYRPQIWDRKDKPSHRGGHGKEVMYTDMSGSSEQKGSRGGALRNQCFGFDEVETFTSFSPKRKASTSIYCNPMGKSKESRRKECQRNTKPSSIRCLLDNNTIEFDSPRSVYSGENLDIDQIQQNTYNRKPLGISRGVSQNRKESRSLRPECKEGYSTLKANSQAPGKSYQFPRPQAFARSEKYIPSTQQTVKNNGIQRKRRSPVQKTSVPVKTDFFKALELEL
ncbi:hypothetical protein PAEPH01_1036 [Pancytospora epiphaga]|nr:hypothetical protein PAEPH01_1036 [Pancytospora epiphaga]